MIIENELTNMMIDRTRQMVLAILPYIFILNHFLIFYSYSNVSLTHLWYK